jgi:uncharacterized protein (DUF1697 family)
MRTYLALLRGINVGGKNLIKMADLAACFEALALKYVRTYIQSGNVIFSTEEPDQTALTLMIEERLARSFDLLIPVVVRSSDELKDIVAQAPKGFGSDPAAYRYDVIFLKEPLSPAEAMQWVTTRAGVDQAFAGNGVLYFSRLTSRASQSRLSRVASTPVYQSMTIRNWNTTSRLLNMMQTQDH